ncbi:spore germination protein YaaH [Vallitalea longa]|uniref:Spore germination protein YaaH n=1 Tax=Vallitalea longa TaxID=2936439 RepID=A0A9W5YDI7_9FIRM|nr:glycoside hydrolase family 18 protein [Vallitalea longa]GKX31972.1 spore germination protein YaaH [Vallitalea longa]
MQIHVVSPGESLFRIARLYNIPVSDIIEINQLDNPANLVVGQTLLIPTTGLFYTIKPGDSLYSISKRYNVTVYIIQRANDYLDPSDLKVGTRIFIPSPEKPIVEVAAYVDLEITGEDSAAYVEEVGDSLTYINVFSYQVNEDGMLTPLDGVEPVINAAYSERVAPLMVITNIDDGGFSIDTATAILNDEEVQDKLLDEIIATMKEKGYLGVDFDFEFLGAENRQPYIDFLKKAKKRLKDEDEKYTLSVALAPKIRDDQVGILYEGHDYKAIGEIVDFIFIMTYEWGWSGGPPRAVAPINEVRRVMEYALDNIDEDKIMMGIPLYGYDWTLPYVEGGKFAKAIGFTQGPELANKYNVEIQYDEKSQSPFLTYTDEEGKQHEVWFEDARSLQAKFDLVKELGLRGFFYWVLGRETPQNWELVEDNFIVNKII